LQPRQFIAKQLQGPPLATLGRRTATESHESGFCFSVQLSRDRRPWFTLDRRRSLTHKLLANPHHLPQRKIDDLGNVPIRPATLPVGLIRHQQDPRPPQLGRAHALLPANRLEL
jgi:hypothetical protein